MPHNGLAEIRTWLTVEIWQVLIIQIKNPQVPAHRKMLLSKTVTPPG
jgi:hypothetical protein